LFATDLSKWREYATIDLSLGAVAFKSTVLSRRIN
jgi:hypothetical protein